MVQCRGEGELSGELARPRVVDVLFEGVRDERHGGERGVLEIGGVLPPRQRAHAIATKRRRRLVS